MFQKHVNIAPHSPARLAATLLLLFVIQVPVAFAQAARRPLIVGVDDLPWGSARHQVVERLGFPAAWRSVESGFGLTYQTEIAGRPAQATYVVTSTDGLVGASYLIEIESRQACESIFGELTDFVSGRHPGVSPEENRMDPGSPDPCESADAGTNAEAVTWKTPTTILGEMNRSVVWRDPNSPARVELRLVDIGMELLYLSGDDVPDVLRQ